MEERYGEERGGAMGGDMWSMGRRERGVVRVGEIWGVERWGIVRREQMCYRRE